MLLMTIDSFKKQFSSYLEDDIGAEDLEDIYKNAHAAIRADPTFKPSDKKKDWKSESVKHKAVRLTHAQRKERVDAKIEQFRATGGVTAAADDDDE